MNKITNEVLAERIEGIKSVLKKGFENTHDRLDKLNGQVKSNTDFKNKVIGALIVISSVLAITGVKVFVLG